MNVKQTVYNQKFHPDITISRKQDAPIENENEKIAKQVLQENGVSERRGNRLLQRQDMTTQLYRAL